MNKSTIISILLIILAAGGSFFAGMKYQESRRMGGAREFSGQLGLRGGGQANGLNRAGFRPVSGEIIANDDKSITVKLMDGSSKIVLLSDKTTINKSDTGTKSDLKMGEKVAVFGQENSDGSVTAQSVQLNPVMRNASESGLPK